MPITNSYAYVPPSVIIDAPQDLTGVTTYVEPSTVAIVARVDSYPTRTMSRVLGNGATAVISAPNVIVESIKLKDYSGKDLEKDTDYTQTQDEEAQTFSIKVINPEIKTQSILISYEYLPDDFFEPLKFFTINSVAEYYGAAYNDDYTINSPITAAARFVFANGGVSVCVVPVYDKEEDESENPKQTIEQALDKLRLHQDIAILVPVAFTSDELMDAREHIIWCCGHQLERRGIFALDGTTTTYTIDDLCAVAGSMDSEQIMFIPNNIASIYVSETRRSQNLPGWLYAAAAAGVAIAAPYYRSLTRLTLSGFYGVQAFLYEEKNRLATAGCSVIEMQNGVIRFRHSVVTRQSMMLDWSYAGIYNYICGALRTLLDVYIGQPSSDTLLTEIYGTVNLFLTQQVESGGIYAFDSLEVSRRANNPEVIDVSFRVAFLRPALWIVVTFDVDLTY